MIQEKLPNAGDCLDLELEDHFSEKPPCAVLDKGGGLYVWTARKRHIQANKGHHTRGKDFSRALYSFIPLAVWQLFRSKSQNSSDNSFNAQSAHPFNPEVVGSFGLYTELYSSH